MVFFFFFLLSLGKDLFMDWVHIVLSFLRLLLFLVSLLISLPHLYHSGWLCRTQFSLHYTEWTSPQITWAPTSNPICKRLFLPQGNLQSISSSKAISLPQGDSGAICEDNVIVFTSSYMHMNINITPPFPSSFPHHSPQWVIVVVYLC